MVWPRLCHSSLNVGRTGAPGGVGLRTGQATAVAVLQCRRSRTAEISCQSSARWQSKGAVANGVLAKSNVMMCWCKARRTTYEIVYPQRCPAACTVSGRMYSEGSTGWDRGTPRHRFFLEEGCKTGLTKRQWHCSFWRWQVGMEMEIAMAAGIF